MKGFHIYRTRQCLEINSYEGITRMHDRFFGSGNFTNLLRLLKTYFLEKKKAITSISKNTRTTFTNTNTFTGKSHVIEHIINHLQLFKTNKKYILFINIIIILITILKY